MLVSENVGTATRSDVLLASAPVSPFRPSRALTVLVAATIGLAPLEGYVMTIHPQLAKLAPALLMSVWALGLFRERRLPRFHLVSVLALVLAGLVFASSAVNPGNTYRLEYILRWLPFLVLTVCFVDVLSTRVHPRVAVYAAATGAVVAGAGALFSFAFLGDERATGPLEDPNDLAYVLTCAVPLLLFGPARSDKRWVRLLAYPGTLIAVAGATATLSRGGLLALGMVGVWALARRLMSVKVMVAGVVALLATGAAAVTFAAPVVDNALQQKSYIGARNIESRSFRWESALRQLRDNPVLGVGPGGNRTHYVAYSNNAEIDEQSPVTHNMYIEVASEIGLIGFFVFVGTMVCAFVVLMRPYPPDRDIALAIQGSLVALASSSIFLSEEYYMPLWMAVSAAAALDLRRRTRRTR